MRFLIIVKATKDSEAGVMPSEQLLREMGKFNEELVKAGVMLAGEGLQPSSKGARVRFSGAKRTVIDGPFAETKELVAGFWLFQVRSKEEAIEWVKRCPAPFGEGTEAEIEIRQVFEPEEFGAEIAASERWPESGVPDNPGAWLMATAKRRAIDELRRDRLLSRKHEELGRELEAARAADAEIGARDLAGALDDDIGDDLLRLMFIACHPA